MIKDQILNIVRHKSWASLEQLRRAVCKIDIAFCQAHRVRLQPTEGRTRRKRTRASQSNPGQASVNDFQTSPTRPARRAHSDNPVE